MFFKYLYNDLRSFFFNYFWGKYLELKENLLLEAISFSKLIDFLYSDISRVKKWIKIFIYNYKNYFFISNLYIFLVFLFRPLLDYIIFLFLLLSAGVLRRCLTTITKK